MPEVGPAETTPLPDALGPTAAAFEDAHQLWHEAADAYHDPEDFRRRAEALVQATRNVTWRLQAAQGQIARFDDWYPDWQELMKADDRLRWLNDARIDVVKRGGLRAGSFAVVRIIDSYLEPKKQLLRLPASTPTTDLVTQSQRQIPTEYRQHIAIEVSRRWVPEGRREELLWLIADCLHVLGALLVYVRAVIEERPPEESPRDFLGLVPRAECMLFDPSWVPLLFEADTGEEFDIAFAPRGLDPALSEASAKRYKSAPRIDATDPIERAGQLHDLARTIFKRDGYYAPMVELRGPKPDDVAVFSMLPTDKRFKFMMWHALGKEVRLHGYTAVIATNEVWTAPQPDIVEPYHDVEQSPGRGEALVTWVDTQAGDARMILSLIVRHLGKPFLKSAQAQIQRTEDGFLSPLQRAWAARLTESR